MKKEEIKKILKPLIKECIKEVIFDDGTLSTVVSEVVKGLGNPLTESRSSLPQHVEQKLETDSQAKARRQKLQETRKKMLDAVGSSAYNGVNVFEGTTPTPEQNKHGALSGVDPRDPGVDITSFTKSSAIWKKLAGK